MIEGAQMGDVYDFAGRVAVVAGAASGRATARRLVYLASDASRFITGQVLRPNGGVAMPG